jgi:exodeoxyribonuclease VII small subunit
MVTRGSGRSASGAEAEGGSVSELSYSGAGAELDAIIEEFETGVIDVDRLVDQLERATEIVDELDRRLRRTRMRVEELVPRLEAIGQTAATGAVVDGLDADELGSDPEDGAGDDDGPAGLF